MRLGTSIQNSISTAFFLLIIIALLCIPAAVQAQAASPVVIETMRVDIWPEYDQPSVLVIYHISLSAQTTFPANLVIRLPAAVGTPHAVAMQDPNGLYNINYEINSAGQWEEITFQTPVPDVRIEFYDPTLAKTGKARSYTFNWPGDYAINNLSLLVQQPVGATNLVLKPDMGNGTQGDDGLTYFTYLAGKVNSGTTFSVNLAYQKPDDTLSTSQLQAVKPSQPINENTAGRVTLGQALPWALGGFGVLLIAAGVFWFFRPGRALQPSAQRQRHGRKPGADSPEEPTALAGGRQDGVFCHQCGKRAAAGDVFCRTCGTKLR
jgi:hypothetical protein